MQIQSKILAWGACNIQKMPKIGLLNVTDVYLRSSKNQSKGDRDLKYGFKNSLGCPLSDLVG